MTVTYEYDDLNRLTTTTDAQPIRVLVAPHTAASALLQAQTETGKL